ncbi:MAG: hypothetical protein AB4372_23945 [Xenococcus sp. (in: cyanobacteria)]
MLKIAPGVTLASTTPLRRRSRYGENAIASLIDRESDFTEKCDHAATIFSKVHK